MKTNKVHVMTLHFVLIMIELLSKILKKKKKMLPGIFKFLALLFLVFLASDQVKLHFRVVHFVFHQCMMVCGRRSLIKEAGKKKRSEVLLPTSFICSQQQQRKRAEGTLVARTSLIS